MLTFQYAENLENVPMEMWGQQGSGAAGQVERMWSKMAKKKGTTR